MKILERVDITNDAADDEDVDFEKVIEFQYLGVKFPIY